MPKLRKDIFGTPEITTEEESEPQQGKPYQGPKVFGRGYYSDITYKNKFDRSGKSTWKVSPDGNSGSMSQTSIRTYEHTTDGGARHTRRAGRELWIWIRWILKKGEENEETFVNISDFVLLYRACAVS